MGERVNMGIRRAQPEDAPALATIYRQALAQTHGDAMVLTDWAPYCASHEHFIYLVEDERPFGFVCAGSPLMDLSWDVKTGEVVGLYLDPGHWGQGMGRKLLVRGLSVLKRRHFESAFLWVRPDASRVLSILVSLGFEAGAMTRTINGPGVVIEEVDYRLSLDEYF